MPRRFVPVLNAQERSASHNLMHDAADDNLDERTNGSKPSLYLGVSDPRFPGRSQTWQEREPHEKVERPACQTSLLGQGFLALFELAAQFRRIGLHFAEHGPENVLVS